MGSKFIEEVVGIVGELCDLVYLAAELTAREEIHRDVEKDARRETEDEAVDRVGRWQVEESREDGRDTDPGRREEENRDWFARSLEAVGRNIARGAFVGNNGESEQETEIGHVAVHESDDGPRGERMSGQFERGVVEGYVQMHQSMSNRVRTETGQNTECDTEAAEFGMVSDCARDKEDGCASYHRAAGQAERPDELSRVRGLAPSRTEDGGPRHRAERNPRDSEHLMETCGERNARENNERDESEETDSRQS